MGSREVYTSIDEPLDTESLKMREQFKGEPLPPEIATVVAKIDFAYLKKFFQNIARQATTDSREINFLERDRVFSGSNAYDDYHNIINLTDEIGIAASVEWSPTEREVLILRFLIHEEIHAISKIICIGEQSSTHNPDSNYYVQAGFARFSEGGRPPMYSPYSAAMKYGAFVAFEEGVTEKLALEATKQYLFDHGWGLEEIDKTLDKVQDYINLTPYGEWVGLVNKLIAKLAKTTGQGKKVVWESLIRGKMEGEKFEDQEIVELFDESISPGFLKDLAGGVLIEEPLKNFIKKYLD